MDMMQTAILQSSSKPLQVFMDLSCNPLLNNTLEMLKTKDVSMTKLFQQKLFDKLANNSGTAGAAFVVNRTFSFYKGTCLYYCFSSFFTFYLCSYMVASYLNFLIVFKIFCLISEFKTRLVQYQC